MCPDSGWGATSWTSCNFTGESTCIVVHCVSPARTVVDRPRIELVNVKCIGNMDADAGRKPCSFHSTPRHAEVFWHLLR